MKVWKFGGGYVNIGIMGKYPERLVNLCISNGIRLKRLERRDWGAEARIAAEDFKRLHGLSRGCGVRLRILKRHGFIRVKKRLKRDAVFIAALACLTVLTAIASTRVWFITIDTVSVPE